MGLGRHANTSSSYIVLRPHAQDSMKSVNGDSAPSSHTSVYMGIAAIAAAGAALADFVWRSHREKTVARQLANAEGQGFLDDAFGMPNTSSPNAKPFLYVKDKADIDDVDAVICDPGSASHAASLLCNRQTHPAYALSSTNKF